MLLRFANYVQAVIFWRRPIGCVNVSQPITIQYCSCLKGQTMRERVSVVGHVTCFQPMTV